MAERKSGPKGSQAAQRPSDERSVPLDEPVISALSPSRSGPWPSESISSSDPEATCSSASSVILIAMSAMSSFVGTRWTSSQCSKSSWNMSRCSDPVTMWSIRSSSSLFTCSRSCLASRSKDTRLVLHISDEHSAARGEYEPAGPRDTAAAPSGHFPPKYWRGKSIFMW